MSDESVWLVSVKRLYWWRRPKLLLQGAFPTLEDAEDAIIQTCEGLGRARVEARIDQREAKP